MISICDDNADCDTWYNISSVEIQKRSVVTICLSVVAGLC